MSPATCFCSGRFKKMWVLGFQMLFFSSSIYLMDTTSGVLPNIEQLTFERKIVLIYSICLYLWCKYFYDG